MSGYEHGHWHLANGLFWSYDLAGGQAITGAWTPISWDTNPVITTDTYTFTPPGTAITVDNDGTYAIDADLSVIMSTYNVPTLVELKLEFNSGGWADIAGTYRYLFVYSLTCDYGSSSISCLKDLTATDQIRLTARIIAGTGNINTAVQGSGLRLMRVSP